MWMKSHRDHGEWKKPDTKDTYDSFCIKFKRSQNWLMRTKIRKVIQFPLGESNVGKWHLRILGWYGNVIDFGLNGVPMGICICKHS